jgi:hypothetical protein
LRWAPGADRLDLDPRQQTEFSAATAELHQAISDPAPDKRLLRRAVQAVMGYLKQATSTALTRAAINAGNLAVTELHTAIHHVHPYAARPPTITSDIHRLG